MNALIFPGQGSQSVGMGLEFYNKFSLVKEIFKEADKILGFPISKIILEGPAEDLQLTKNTQPAILTVSYSIFIERNIINLKVPIFRRTFLGEYSAYCKWFKF